MYLPEPFAEADVAVLHQLIRSRPLATLVTLAADGLEANHIPLLLSPEPAPFGTLRGHVARANPLWRGIGPGTEALAIFHGPEAYVSPSWYPSKARDGKAVPTWNYAVVHARGKLRAVDDAAWLRAHLEELSAAHEAAFPAPWRMADAPADFIAQLVGKVVGIELAVAGLEGKWKVGQNQPAENRRGAARGLRERGGRAAEMADEMEPAGERR